MRIDLSCDMGEASNTEEQAVEDALWPLVSSASIACGGHAGDADSMSHAVGMAKSHGVVLAAHPSYPDRENFGRRSMAMDPDALRESVAAQIEALRTIAVAEGIRVRRVKPHGALYNDLHRDPSLARTVVEAIASVGGDLALVASPGSAAVEVAKQAGVPVVLEAFADRRYRPDGSLVPRGREDALLRDFDAAAEQAVRLAESSEVVADDGTVIRVEFQTLCIHGDMPGSLERLRRIRDRLEGAGFTFGVNEEGVS